MNVRGTPFHRVDAARQALRLLRKQKHWQDALVISKGAVNLLPTMNNRSLSREDQEIVASKFAGLVSGACSLSLQAGENASEALVLLERGRGSIMGLLVDDRSSLSQLEVDYPGQAQSYRDLLQEVNSSSQGNLAVETGRRRLGKQVDLVGDLSKRIDEIGKLPGYGQFLLGQNPKQLMELAREGPLVVVNVTDLRSDASIVSPSSIKCVSLPKITPSWVKRWLDQIHDRSVNPVQYSTPTSPELPSYVPAFRIDQIRSDGSLDLI